jgi:peptide/nickel transport system substrate-binding protein
MAVHRPAVARMTRRAVLRGAGAMGTVLGTGAFIAACGGKKAAETGGGTQTTSSGTGGTTPEAPSVAARRGGTMRWPVGATDHLDSYRDAGTGLFPIQAVYNGLVRLRIPPGKGVLVQQDLAEKWEQQDPLTLTFTLAPNIKWHSVPPTNGRAFRAEDVKLAYERMRTDQPEFTLRPFLSMVKSIESPDDRTVVFKFNEPYGPFLSEAGDSWHVIQPRELWTGDTAKNSAVGTGGFILQKWERGVVLEMRANKEYFKKDKPYLDAIDFLSLTDASATQAQFLTRQIDVASWPANLKDQVTQRLPDAQFYDVAFSPWIIQINNERPPLNDVRVRQAIMYATDRDLISKIGFQGRTKPGQPLGSLLQEYQLPEAELPRRDVQRAKQLLAAAGYGNGFTIKNSTYYTTADAGPEQVRQALAEVGINVEFLSLEWGNWRRNVYTLGDMDICTTNVFVYPNPDKQLWINYHSTGGNNNSHVKDARLDQMLQDARRELDSERAKQRYKDIARYLIFELTASVWPVETRSLFVHQGRVKNLYFDEGSSGHFLYYKSADELWLER